jgi:hypothetical protein
LQRVPKYISLLKGLSPGRALLLPTHRPQKPVKFD